VVPKTKGTLTITSCCRLTYSPTVHLQIDLG